MANSWNESGTTWSTGRWGTTDAITSGWGADAWNTGGSWGQATDELALLTGVSATFSIGEIISGSNTGWGRDFWGEEPWGESFDPVVNLDSLSATISLGDAEAFNERGWGRLSWGQADWNEGSDETVSISGVEATASIGSITPAFTYLLEVGPAFKMTGEVGDVGLGLGINVSGVESTFATPTIGYVGHTVGWGRNEWGEDSWGESPDEVITLVGRSIESFISANNSWGESTWNNDDVWGGTFDVNIKTAYD